MENIFEIELSKSNCKALVSINKINNIEAYKWYLGKDNYPFTYINGARIPLHRYIWFLNTGNWKNNYVDCNNKVKKLYIDHINRNKLDATDENLRLSTPAENSYNKVRKNQPLHNIKLKKAGYEVIINKNKQIHKINNIKSLEEAKEIYNMMANELFGEYAVLYTDINICI